MPDKLPVIKGAFLKFLNPNSIPLFAEVDKVGGAAILRLPRGLGGEVYCFTDSELVSAGLNQWNNKGPLMSAIGRKLFGNGMVGSDDTPRYRVKRKAFARHTHGDELTSLEPIIYRVAREELIKARTAGVFPLGKMFSTMMQKITMSTLVSHPHPKLEQMMATLYERSVLLPIGDLLPPISWALSSPFSLWFAYQSGQIDKLMINIINFRQTLDPAPQDLLHTLTVMDAALTRREILDEFRTILVAGGETTALPLGMLLWIAQQMPDVAADIIPELPFGRPATFADWKNASRYQAAWKEALRRFPPGLKNFRLTQAGQLGNHFIPGGRTALLSAYSMHHDPRIYPEPHTFRHTRWLGTNAPSSKYFAGYGANTLRGCVGMSLSQLIGIIVHTLTMPGGEFPIKILSDSAPYTAHATTEKLPSKLMAQIVS